MNAQIDWRRKIDDRVEIIFRKYDLLYNEGYEKKQVIVQSCVREIEQNNFLAKELLHSKESLNFFIMQTIMHCIKED